MTQDEQHLQLLSIFHYVCAAMVALAACVPIIHLVIGVMMIARPDSFGPAKEQPPAIIGWFLIMIASAAIMIGWTMAGLLVYGGRCLKRRVRYSFCIVVAGIACLFMPFGTVLGIFTILLLMKPSVKALFEAHAQPVAAA